MNRTLLFVALLGACGLACAPVSVSHLQSARPTGSAFQAGVGGGIGREGEQGTRGGAPGDRNDDHFAPSVEAELHFSPLEDLDLGLQLFTTGADVSVRYRFLNAPPFYGAAGAAFGFFQASYDNSITGPPDPIQVRGQFIDVPLTLTWQPYRWLGLYGGPLITGFNAERASESGARNARFVQFGGFAGVTIGPQWFYISIGVTAYAENTHYPIESFATDATYFYPWAGVLFSPPGLGVQSGPTDTEADGPDLEEPGNEPGHEPDGEPLPPDEEVEVPPSDPPPPPP